MAASPSSSYAFLRRPTDSIEPEAYPSMASTSLEHASSSTSAQGSDSRPPRKPVSRSKKAVAAVTGAVVTSFLMTPFDVIKTRLQTQTSPEPLFVPSSKLASPVSFNLASTSASSSLTQPSQKYAAVSRANAHPATCCQQTFFTANNQEQSLTCRYDPRISPTSPAVNRVSNSRSASRSASRSSLPHSGASTTLSHSAPKRSSVRILPSPPPAPNTYIHPIPSATAANGSASCACAFPDRATATRGLEAAAAHHGRLTGLWDGVVKVGRAEGIRGLYRGLAPTLMMTVPSQVTYMTCYDYFRSKLLPADDPVTGPSGTTQSPAPSSLAPSLSAVTAQSLYASLFAGALARGISATLVTPFELVRTRLQASSHHSSSLRSILSSLVTEMRTSQQGPLILWRGLSPTLWRDVPFSAIYFAGYETGKRVLTGGGLGEGNAQGSGEEFAVAFVSGAVSGSIAAVVTHPFDLVKTRLQAAATNSFSQPRLSASLRDSAAGLGSGSAGVFRAMRQIVQQEGIPGLFRGLSPRTAKVAPACGVMIASFEVVGRLLSDY